MCLCRVAARSCPAQQHNQLPLCQQQLLPRCSPTAPPALMCMASSCDMVHSKPCAAGRPGSVAAGNAPLSSSDSRADCTSGEELRTCMKDSMRRHRAAAVAARRAPAASPSASPSASMGHGARAWGLGVARVAVAVGVMGLRSQDSASSAGASSGVSDRWRRHKAGSGTAGAAAHISSVG